MSETNPEFEIKSTNIDLLSLVLKTTDQQALLKAIHRTFSTRDMSAQRFVLDLSVFVSTQEIDLARILSIATQYGIKFIALRHNDESFADLARKYQLVYLRKNSTAYAQSKSVEPKKTTMTIRNPVRTGQQIYAQNGDLIVLSMVSAGAEVIADGNIHIYAPLRGRALAGASGDRDARIFVQSMQAELVSIAGVYLAIEKDLPSSIQKQATQIYLEQNRIIMKPLS